MKKILLLLSITIFYGCSKKDNVPDISECLELKIKQFSTSTYICSNATIIEYRFQNKEVYVLDIGACGGDIPASVVDKECNDLGFLGGLQGNSIINGESFSNALYLRTIWKK